MKPVLILFISVVELVRLSQGFCLTQPLISKSGFTTFVEAEAKQKPILRQRSHHKCTMQVVDVPRTKTNSDSRNAFYNVGSLPAQERKLEVMEGRVPEWLVGTYYRNGPGMFNAGKQELRHLFDGYALLSKFEFKPDSSVVWKSSFLQTEAYAAAQQGEMMFNEFGTAAGDSVMTKAKGILRAVAGALTDNASVSIVRLLDGTLLALTESVRGTIEFDGRTLQAKKRFQWEDNLDIQINTAHWMPDGHGGFYNLATTVGPINHYLLLHIPAGSRHRQVVARIPAPLPPSWHHAFALSEKHFIVIECPTPFNLGGLMGLGELTNPTHCAVDWRPSRPTRIFVVSRATGEIVSQREVPAFFYFHVANAFDSADGGSVAVDLCAYADPAIVNDLALPVLRAKPDATDRHAREVSESRLTRLTIPLTPGGAVITTPLDDPAVTGSFHDFPCIHPDRLGRAYRYVWAAGCARPTAYSNSITKTDLAAGSGCRWSVPGGVVGEPVMVPRPRAGPGAAGGAAAEDDGVVMSVVTDAGGLSSLVILDAATLRLECRLGIPVPLPYAFHGLFVPAAAAH